MEAVVMVSIISFEREYEKVFENIDYITNERLDERVFIILN
jgi:hypothetical protein